MRRSLVLTDEAARHPFRTTLPPHVRGSGAIERAAGQLAGLVTSSDMRGFATVYFATFAAVLAFIA